MSCPVIVQPFMQIITAALLIAGKGQETGVTESFWAKQAEECLQLIIGQWSAEDLYNFYINTIHFESFDGKLEYSIGAGLDIDALPFNTITSVWYYWAGINRPLLFESMQSFNYFTYQNFINLPIIYTWNNQYNVTTIKMLPRPIDALPITINGKQTLGTPSLFDSTIQIPDYAKPALIFQVANELYARGAGSPNGNFGDTLKYHLSVLKKCSKQDKQVELKPALFGGGLGRGSYYYTGMNTGGGNYGF